MIEDILYKKHNFLDKTKKCIIGLPIRVYDMKSGGYSILKKNKCFSKKEIEYLESVSKFDRNYYIGNKIRDEKLTDVLMNGFIDARKRFMYYNDIIDSDILSIKKDALFIINRPANKLVFDGYTFKIENVYSSYFYLNSMELYFSNQKNIIDLKGINEENLKKHKEFFLDDLCKIFNLTEGNDRLRRNQFIKDYRSLYLNRELDIGCYRELSIDSYFCYKDKIGNLNFYLDDTDDLYEINITYNYKNYLLPFFNMIL